jgi:hypothetical protein
MQYRVIAEDFNKSSRYYVEEHNGYTFFGKPSWYRHRNTFVTLNDAKYWADHNLVVGEKVVYESPA